MSKLYVNPLPVRIWHWANVFLFIVLIVTGVQIRYLDLFSLMSFRTAVVVHNWVAFALIGNFFIWLLFYLFSDKNRAYHPEFNIIKLATSSFRQMQYYGYGMFKGERSPHHMDPYDKFNPLQRMLYQILMLFLLPLQFATGLLSGMSSTSPASSTSWADCGWSICARADLRVLRVLHVLPSSTWRRWGTAPRRASEP